MSSDRNFVVWHQILSITEIDFTTETIYGFTELTIIPTKEDLVQINLNCKECKIFTVVFNGIHEATELEYSDPLNLRVDESRRDLQSFLSNEELASIAVDPDEGNGEIVINIPEAIRNDVKKDKPMMLAIEFCLEKPQGGVRFMRKRPFDKTSPSDCYLCTVDHNACYWFPCVNSLNEVCTWKIEVLVEKDFTVVASGNLVEVETLTQLLPVSLPTLNTESDPMPPPTLPKSISMKKYHYFMSVPTCPANIGLVVGQFDSMIDENLPEVTYYFDSMLKPLVKDTCSFMSELFDFYEDVLSVSFPFASHKQVFLPDLAEDYITFSTLTVINVNVLHSERIIEQSIESRKILANLIGEQYFLCLITMHSQHDWWLNMGLSQFFAGLYFKKLFGNNEYKHMIYQNMKDVCKYEREQSHVVLDFNWHQANIKEAVTRPLLSLRYHIMGCPSFFRIAEKKAHLVVRLIDEHLGRDLMVQVVNKLLNNALESVKVDNYTERCRSAFNLNIESFLEALSFFSTNKDIRHLLDLWVFKPGVARLNCSFSFNRKKNLIELEIKQDMSNQKGYRKYSGPITLIVQETEGSFTHNLHIESDQVSSKFEIVCHSKGKRNKKKKIPLITGEEVDIDTSQSEADSPILWLRLDSDLKIIRELSLDQPDHSWQNELRFERDICAQIDSVEALSRFASAQPTRAALVTVLENPECFYRVRVRAAQVLADVFNRIVHTWNGPLPLVPTFKKLFMCPQAPLIVASNNFSDLQMYFLQKSLPIAMGTLRNSHNLCPSEVVRFLLDLIKFNENSRNSYSDGAYRSCLIDALGATISTSVASVVQTDGLAKSNALTQDMRLVVEEIILRLNLEKIFPTYRYAITCSCLRALRNLQKHGHVPEDIEKFKEYATYENNFEDVRLVAFEIIIEYLAVRNDQELLDWLLNFVEIDPSYRIKHSIIQNLAKYPPFKFNSDETPLNTENLVNRLWSLLNKFNYNNALKASIAELYQIFYGIKNPKCLRHINKQTLKIGNVEPLQMNIEN